MEKDNEVQNNYKQPFFEFYNYWRKVKGLDVLAILWVDDIFAYYNCLSIHVLNFEFRFYFHKHP